jgi:opacity protein-like surface antigen
MRSRLVLILSTFAVLLMAVPARADSDVKIGIRGGYYFDASEPFLGAELLVRIADQVYFNPNFEWVFFDDRYYTINADFHYDFDTHNDTYVWVGMGVGAVAIDPPGPAAKNTDAALNLLFGIGLKRHPVIPYLQAKAAISDDSEFSLGVGLRF